MKKEARKEAREEESEESLVCTCQKKEVFGSGLPKMKMPHLVQIRKNLKECIYLTWQKVLLDTFAKEVSRECWRQKLECRVEDQIEMNK